MAKCSRVVVVTWPDFDVSFPEGRALLKAAGLEPRLEPKLGARSTDELTAVMDGAAGAIVSTDPFDDSVLASCPTLKVVARVGVGYDSIDIGAATREGVAVTVTTGASESTVADHALALMLGVLRDVVGHDARVRDGQWARTGVHAPSELTGTTVLLLGYGAIGRQVAKRLKGFDVRVLVHDPGVEGVEGVEEIELVGLEDGLATADVVSVHVPLLESTRGLVGRRELRAMKRGSVLVNLSRGGVVDEQALIESLDSGHLLGAGVDVFEHEPPGSSALLTHPRVISSPHIGGVSVQSLRRMLDLATRSVIDVLQTGSTERVVNPAALDIEKVPHG